MFLPWELVLLALEVALFPWETSLFTWEISTVYLGSPKPGWALTAWGEAKLLPELVLEEGELLPSWDIALLALPSLGRVFLGRTALASWEPVLSQGRGLPACLGRDWVVMCLSPSIAWVRRVVTCLRPSITWVRRGGIASFLRNSTVSATFPRRHAVGVDCTGFLGSSAVLGRGSLPACNELAITQVALVAWEASQVILPSFLHNKLLNFLCACF